MKPLHEYRVGQLYRPTRTRWDEGVDYNYRSGSHELRMFLGGPTQREIRDITQGPCEFALLPYKDVLFFLYRFGTALPWSDATYSFHLVRRSLPDEAIPPGPAQMQEPHDLLTVILVDATTGVIKGLRVATFSPAFTAALRSSIQRQVESPWPGDKEYDRQLAEAYAKYPSSQAMLKDAISRTVGGK
jgi:hypothetical protein